MLAYTDAAFEEEFDDELDLLQLISNSANDLNQYLLFKGSSREWYGLNVSKIEEIMIYDKQMELSRNSDRESIIFATADIRGSMTTLLYFDEWYGNKRLADEEYELIILLNYGGHRLGIIVKEVADIVAIEPSQMSDNSQNNAKSTFVAKVSVEGEMHMCTIYDGDKMLLDIFDDVTLEQEQDFSRELKETLAKKMIFFADDSKFVRTLVERLFLSLGVEYKIFHDGADLLRHLSSHPNCEVDLFITDLEMPQVSGREVIRTLRKQSEYKDVSILVHTNMSNSIMAQELIEIGATAVISKIDMERLAKAVMQELGVVS